MVESSEYRYFILKWTFKYFQCQCLVDSRSIKHTLQNCFLTLINIYLKPIASRLLTGVILRRHQVNDAPEQDFSVTWDGALAGRVVSGQLFGPQKSQHLVATSPCQRYSVHVVFLYVSWLQTITFNMNLTLFQHLRSPI